MNKRIPSDLSAGVLTCPQVSLEEIREERKNPPVAPPPEAVALQIDPVQLEVRQLRVKYGSRRKRDLAAVRMAKDLAAHEARSQEWEKLRAAQRSLSSADLRIWVEVRRRLRTSLGDSRYRLWIKPIRPVAASQDLLYLAAPDGIRAWTERRYSSVISEALRRGSDFTRISFAPPAVMD